MSNCLLQMAGAWQDLTLSDKSGIVYGKCWSEHISDETDNYVGKIVRVIGKVELFREQCMLRIVRITPAETYDPADFRVTLSSYDTEQSILCLKKLLDEIEDPRLYSLCCAVFGIGTARYERFLESPLTEEATHSYFGGFLKHTINVANLADIALTICEGSPNEVIRPIHHWSLPVRFFTQAACFPSSHSALRKASSRNGPAFWLLPRMRF